ncbi:MAG TPA: Rdx family protein [Dehalococcoidia bacterium]|nr:Rdx family protein [Dehalococcoidia bacterium]
MDAAPAHRIEIEFCTVCKFQGRAFWLARELFDQRPDLATEIALIPSAGGAFLVRYDGHTVYDRAVTGRFPEPKEVREAILAVRGLPQTPPRHDHAPT